MIASKTANKMRLCLICTWIVLKNSSSPLSLGWRSCSASKWVLGCQHVMSYHKTSMPCNLYAGCNRDWLFVTDAWKHFQLCAKFGLAHSWNVVHSLSSAFLVWNVWHIRHIQSKQLICHFWWKKNCTMMIMEHFLLYSTHIPTKDV